jgi:hypothetical protein
MKQPATMNCPSKNELINYLVNDFRDEREKTMLANHIQACPDCRKQVAETEQRINALLQESERECELVQNHLMDFMEGRSAMIEGINVSEHLDECDRCQFIYLQLQKELSLEQAASLNFPVPKRLTQNLEKLLATTLEAKPATEPGTSLKEKISELAERIALVLLPAPEPAFLGTQIAGEKAIATASRNLVVEAGGPGRVVRIYSMKDVELGRQVSDRDGVVRFKDFEPGEYKLVVEGFEIKEAQSSS